MGGFSRPGKTHARKRTRTATYRAGWEAVHVAVDDATRLATWRSWQPDRGHAVGLMTRAIAWFTAHGIRVTEVMIDNRPPFLSALWATLSAPPPGSPIDTRRATQRLSPPAR